MQLDKDGNVVFADSNTNSIRAVKLDGTDAYTVSAGADDYIDTVLRFADGSLAASIYGDDGQQLYRVNAESGTLEDPISINFDTYSAVSGGGDYDFYYTNGSNFYGYSVEKQQSEKIFNWLNCDVNGSNVTILNVDENGTVTCWLNEWNDKDRTSSIDLITVSKVPYDSVPHKESITLAAIYLDYDVQDMIVKFNRSNDQYRIEVKDYSEYNNDQDGWDAGQTKLNTEILSGNLPDIFCLNGLNYRQLASKGCLLYTSDAADE